MKETEERDDLAVSEKLIESPRTAEPNLGAFPRVSVPPPSLHTTISRRFDARIALPDALLESRYIALIGSERVEAIWRANLAVHRHQLQKLPLEPGRVPSKIRRDVLRQFLLAELFEEGLEFLRYLPAVWAEQSQAVDVSAPACADLKQIREATVQTKRDN